MVLRAAIAPALSNSSVAGQSIMGQLPDMALAQFFCSRSLVKLVDKPL